MKEVYITSSGKFLPNEAICNEEMENYLGRINGKDSRAKDRVLKQNGIKTRYYASVSYTHLTLPTIYSV